MTMPNSVATNGWHPHGAVRENVTLERDFENIKVEKFHYKKRCEQLEQLVRYMYRCYVIGHDWGVWGAPERQWVEERMTDLGLLDGEDNA